MKKALDTSLRKIEQAQALYSFGNSIWDSYTRFQKWQQGRTTWQVQVMSEDRLYAQAVKWLAEESRIRARRVPVTAVTDYRDYSPNSIAVLFEPDSAPLKIVVGGYRVTVRGMTKSPTPLDEPISSNGGSTIQPRLVFTAESQAGREAVIDKLESLAATNGAKRSSLFLTDKWGGWNRRDDLPTRDLSTVILADNLVEDLQSDIRKFLASEDRYAALGVPYHRGYLFHGPPGTGKSSIVKALAEDAKLDIFYLSLASVKSDTDLLTLLSQTHPKSILLLEDIDVFHAARDRDADGKEMTLSGLLNALDGVATPHGLITVMTTNNIDTLDDALLRAGRADRVVEFSYPTAEQVDRMLIKFCPEARYLMFDTDRPLRAGMTTADIVETVKRHLESTPDVLARALEETLYGLEPHSVNH